MLRNNKSKILANFLIAILVANFLVFPQILIAQDGEEDDVVQEETAEEPPIGEDEGPTQEEIEAQQEQERLDKLSQEIKDKQDKIRELEKKIGEHQKNINYHRGQSLSLSNQIGILSNEIGKLQIEIELKNNQIDQTNLEIQDTENNIENTEKNIVTEKEQLVRFIQKMNRMDKQTEIELLLTIDSFSDYYNHLHTLSIMQGQAGDSLHELKNFKDNLEEHIANMEKKKESLNDLKAELERKKSNLNSRTYAKQSLLSESRDSESKFKSLVAELKSEQAGINADIISLERQIREKLSGDEQFEALGDSDFIWPVPNRGITAYFHDPTYPFRYIFEHPAIDIKSAQGSPIKAAASGYVGKVRIQGTNYGYIMLIHSNGFSTVYGHTSKSYVLEDQYVSKGETIGLSGGMPGTTGCGRLSTGPHLHFEIRKNGIPVNPLDYLP